MPVVLQTCLLVHEFPVCHTSVLSVKSRITNLITFANRDSTYFLFVRCLQRCDKSFFFFGKVK